MGNGINTGNAIVDEVATINFTGNVIPESWFKTIVKDNGKTNMLSIMLLADIVYWYRPQEVRDEMTNAVEYRKKFHADLLQRSYDQICEKFNCSHKQAREALLALEELNVIKRVFRTVTIGQTKVGNVMFIELFPDVLFWLTYPEKEDGDSGSDEDSTLFTKKEIGGDQKEPSLQKGETLFTKKEIAASEKVKTNTKNTTEITTKNSKTTTDSIKPLEEELVVVKNLFRDFNLSENDVMCIYIAAGKDVDVCRQAIVVFENQTRPVKNVVGWFIAAVQEGYKFNPSTKAVKKNRFCDFDQRSLDIETLEKVMFTKKTG